MLNFNEKRPERVLTKNDHQEVKCPSCGSLLKSSVGATNAQCQCGQQLNWGLIKN
jgi:LSD1 subclass zinc finger protein